MTEAREATRLEAAALAWPPANCCPAAWHEQRTLSLCAVCANIARCWAQGGKMRTSIGPDGQQYPPLLEDVRAVDPSYFMALPADQQMTCPPGDTGCTSPNVTSFFAVGSARFNLHIGVPPPGLY